MNSSNKPLITALSIAVLAFLIFPPVAIYLIDSKQDEETRANTIAGCERTNTTRASTFSNAVLDALTREAAANQYVGEAKVKILRYARLNWDQAQGAIDAAAEFPSTTWPETPGEALIVKLAAPYLDHPGPPEVNCKAAF